MDNFILGVMNSRSRSAKLSKSQFESSFQKVQTLKRNKRYIDIPRAYDQEKQRELYRRIPNSKEDHKTEDKINQSFANSTAELTEKLDREIDKYRSRLSYSYRICESPRSLSCTPQASPTSQAKIRSFSMARMTSRDYFHDIKNKRVKDERLFNNFQRFQPQEPLACNFQKMKGHKLDNTHKHLNDLYHESQKPYEEFYYRKTTNYSRVNYNSEKKMKSQRYFYTPPRADARPSTDLEPKNVENGAKLATNFKGRNISTTNIDDFYRNSGRRIAPQLQMRNMNSLTNHWNSSQEQIQFEVVKAKEDMKAQRLRRIVQSKKVQVHKNKVCDQKFFRRRKKLQK